MPSVKVRENEPFEFALRRFKRTCEKAGVLAETRKREFYEKPTQERKRKARRRGQASGLAALARRHQAPAPVLIYPHSAPPDAAVFTKPASRRLFVFSASVRSPT